MCGVDFTADIKCGKRGRGREGVGRHIQTLLRIGERDREKGGREIVLGLWWRRSRTDNDFKIFVYITVPD